jgi:hypothetical protein
MSKWLTLVAALLTVGCGAARAPIARPTAPAQTFLTTPAAQASLRQAFARAYYATQQTGGGGITPSGGRPAGAGGAVSGPILFPDGSSSAPSITFSSDPTTGFFKGVAAGIDALLGGQDAFRFTSTKLSTGTNVAIGLNAGTGTFGSPDVTLTATGAGKLSLTGTTPMLQFGGTTSSFAAWKSVGISAMDLRAADDSGFGTGRGSWIISGTLSNNGTGNFLYSTTGPSAPSACGTSPAVTTANGSAVFVITGGTGGTATGCTVALPAAATGWNCTMTNITAAAAHRANVWTVQTASTTTSVTWEYQTVSTGAATAFTASDVFRGICFAY